MNCIKHLFLVLISAVFVVSLASCGGGGTSSGGGGTQFAGTYSGAWKATFAAAGMSEAGNGVITVVIKTDSKVILDPDTPTPGTGTISGNTITANYLASGFNSSGFKCTGKVSVTGTVANKKITGSIGPSSFKCNGVPFTTQGSYTASKTARAPFQGAVLSKELREAVRQAVGQ